MFDRMLLFVLKKRLKKYKKNSEWYHKNGCDPNWYDEQGIPDLNIKIIELENKIQSR